MRNQHGGTRSDTERICPGELILWSETLQGLFSSKKNQAVGNNFTKV